MNNGANTASGFGCNNPASLSARSRVMSLTGLTSRAQAEARRLQASIIYEAINKERNHLHRTLDRAASNNIRAPRPRR